MARTMLMHEMMSMVISQKWRKPMMSVRVSRIARITRTQILGWEGSIGWVLKLRWLDQEGK